MYSHKLQSKDIQLLGEGRRQNGDKNENGSSNPVNQAIGVE